MLKTMRLKNFKTWATADIEFGRVTGFFGTNSSGKSSLMQFLLLLKQTKEATDRSVAFEFMGPYVELGLFSDVIHRRNEKASLEWELTLSLANELAILDPAESSTAKAIARGQELTVEGKTSYNENKPRSDFLRYALGGVDFALGPKANAKAGFDLTTNAKNFRFNRTTGRAWQLPGPVKSYAFPDQARTYFQNAGFLSDLENCLENEIENIYYLGPLREYPKRDYLWAQSVPHDVGDRGQRTVDAILAATVSNEKRNRRPNGRLKPFQQYIASLLQDMGLVHSFSVTEIAPNSNRWQAKVVVREGGTEVLLTDVGFGVSQVLPVLTLLQYVPEGSIVLLEQPEIHLHPLAQAGLADIILNAALRRNVQVIVESHSEHFLLRLQRRIAEGADFAGNPLTSEDTKLYFCDAPGGTSTLTRLELDLLGNILNWPANFMGNAFAETAAAEKARLKRKLAAK